MRFSAEKKRIIFILLSLITLGQFGVDLYLPSLPFIVEDLGSSASAVKLTIPLYLIGFGISQLFYGPLTDIFGRRLILNFGLSIYIAGAFGAFFSPSVLLFILFRVVQGIGAGASIVTMRAVLRDTFHGKQMAKVTAWISIVWSFIPIAAPAIGGYIQHYLGWRDNFLSMFIYGAGVWLLCFFLLPETLDQEHRKTLHIRPILNRYRHIFLDKLFISCGLCFALCYSYFICYVTVSPFLLQEDLGLTPIQFGWATLILACGVAVGAFLSSKAVVRLKITHLISIGAVVMLISSTILLILSLAGQFNIYTLLIPPFFANMGSGLVVPNVIAGAMTHYKSNAGIAGASLGFLQMSASFLFSIFMSHFPANNAIPLSFFLFLISLGIFLLFFVYIRTHYQEEKEPKSLTSPS